MIMPLGRSCTSTSFVKGVVRSAAKSLALKASRLRLTSAAFFNALIVLSFLFRRAAISHLRTRSAGIIGLIPNYSLRNPLCASHSLRYSCQLDSIETPLLTAIQKKIFPEETSYTVIVLEGVEMMLPGA